jgi:hypothetical protein
MDTTSKPSLVVLGKPKSADSAREGRAQSAGSSSAEALRAVCRERVARGVRAGGCFGLLVERAQFETLDESQQIAVGVLNHELSLTCLHRTDRVPALLELGRGANGLFPAPPRRAAEISARVRLDPLRCTIT